MAIFQYTTAIVLVINFCLVNARNIRSVDTYGLIWAPIKTVKYPYVTFINDFNFPTWWTRHSMTKEKGQLQHLQLPKNVPFALVCGACFQHSKLTTNLTMSISDHLSQSVPKRKRDSSFEYDVGLNKCLMTYMITEPIQKDGTITCSLQRGKQRINEVISFNAVDVDIQEPAEELEIEDSESGIELHCPEIEQPARDNPIINVWHVENKQSSKNSVGSPILKTGRTLTLDQPKYTTTIVCSVYNINTPSVVHQLRYKIQGSQTNAKSEYHVSEDILNFEGEAEILPPRINLSSSVLAIIITAAIVCVLLAVMGTYRFIAAARRD